MLLYLYYKAASRKSQEKDHYPVYTDFRLSQDQKFPKNEECPETSRRLGYYYEKTGRRITFEYSLVGGQNDSKEDARQLYELIHDINCHVNLIPVNPVKERSYVQSEKKVLSLIHI